MAAAFIFPGQGCQVVGMMADARATFPVVEDTITEASDALGYDMGALYAEGPAAQLDLTEFTQPAVLTASTALYRAWLSEGGEAPAVGAGHSLGEYSALVAAGTFSLTDAVRLVRRRGQAMQAAVPVGEGSMSAIIGLDDDFIVKLCAEITEDTGDFVGAVNFNSPGQVVIAGVATAVAAAGEALLAAGARRALPLPVSAPFHTPLMGPAAEVMADELASISMADPAMPVVSNVNGVGQTDAETIRGLLVEQVASPVRWTDCIGWMRDQGSTQFVECGPGKVLAGLVRRIDKTAATFTTEAPEAMREAIAATSS